MQILLVNGSSRVDGNTAEALTLLDESFQKRGVKTTWFQINSEPLRGCIGCNGCNDTNRCVFQDDRCNELIEDILAADGVIVGSPVYFAAPNGALCSLLDHAFFATCTKSQLFKGKPAAALVTCEWTGGTAALDRLHRYFVPSQMPVVTSNDYTVFQGNSLKNRESRAMRILTALGDKMIAALKSRS